MSACTIAPRLVGIAIARCVSAERKP